MNQEIQPTPTEQADQLTQPTQAAQTTQSVQPEEQATPEMKCPIDVKPGDYISRMDGMVTRVKAVEEGCIVTVWDVVITPEAVTRLDIKLYTPAKVTKASKHIKVIDGSNSRTVLFEGIEYALDKLENGKVIIKNLPGVWPADIFEQTF